ncbi:hypothetical protein ACEF17_11585, partial [Streptococcus hyovaginalis]
MEKENQILFHIEETTILEVQKALNSGQITSWELTKKYIKPRKTFDSTLYQSLKQISSCRRPPPVNCRWAADLKKKQHPKTPALHYNQ